MLDDSNQDYQITVNGTKVFHANSGDTILSAAADSGIVFNHSCFNGRCGACRGSVVRGESVVAFREEALSSEEIESGAILTCCRRPCSNMEISVDLVDQGMNLGRMILPAKIVSLTKLTVDVLEVCLRLPPTNQFRYMPGQHVKIIGRGGVNRSYSLASADNADGLLKFYIRRVEGGEFSDYWFSRAAANDLLRIDGPLGTFGLRDSNVNTIVMLATGTGIAPIKAMLESMHLSSQDFSDKKVYLYWGGRTATDFFWDPNSLSIKVEYTAVLSDELLIGTKQYVQNRVLSDGIDLSSAHVYACGSSQMVQDSKKLLVASGLKEENFFCDMFVATNQKADN